MGKYITAFVVIYVLFQFIGWAQESGTPGFAGTVLTVAVDTDDTTVTVEDTSGFPDDADPLTVSGVLFLGSEVVTYKGITDGPDTFTGVVRAQQDSTAEAHAVDTNIYVAELGVLNTALGFEIASTQAATGQFSAVQVTTGFWTNVLGRLILWDYPFFTGQLIYIRYLFSAITIGFVVVLGFLFLNTVFGLFR